MVAVVDGKSNEGKWSVLVTCGIGMLALLDNEVGREKIQVIFGRRYHRLTGTQYHTAIATIVFLDIAGLELLEFLGLISFDSFSFSYSRLVPRPSCSRRIPS